MINEVLSGIIKAGQSRLIKAFFERIADARNIMRLTRYLNAVNSAENDFISGGGISTDRLRDCCARNDLSEAGRILTQFTGEKTETLEPEKIEHLVYKAITQFTANEGKDPLGSGLILDYLWRSSIEVMNLTTLFFGRGIDRGKLAEQLVR